MSNREIEWSAKKLTLKASQGMLKAQQQDARAREYKTVMVERKSEGYIRETFINKASMLKVTPQLPSQLRNKQNRNFVMAFIENIAFISRTSFFFCAGIIEHCLTWLLPAREAREVGILATAMGLILLAFAAVGEAPRLYTTVTHDSHARHVIAELRAFL